MKSLKIFSVALLLMQLLSCSKDKSTPSGNGGGSTPPVPEPIKIIITGFARNPVTVGDTITINGDKFGTNIADLTVNVNGSNAKVLSVLENQIKAIAEKTGSNPVTVTRPSIPATVVSSNALTVNDKPATNPGTGDPGTGNPGNGDEKWTVNRYAAVANGGLAVIDAAGNLTRVDLTSPGGVQVSIKAPGGTITTELLGDETGTSQVTYENGVKWLKSSNVSVGVGNIVMAADSGKLRLRITEKIVATKTINQTDVFMRNNGIIGGGMIGFTGAGIIANDVKDDFDAKLNGTNRVIIATGGVYKLL